VYQPCESQIFNPEDKPWESAKRFDLIDEVAKARGIEVEFLMMQREREWQ
jgi:hypothetical protein